MRRRALLAALGTTVVAGCASTTDDGPTGSTTTRDALTASDAGGETTAERTTEPTGNDDDADDAVPEPPAEYRGYDVVDLEVAPETCALSGTGGRTDDGGRFRVVFAGTATASSPATLRVWLTNDSEYEQPFDLSHLPAFGGAESDTPHLLGRPRERLGSHWERRRFLVPSDDHPAVGDPPRVERADDGRWDAARMDDWSLGVRRLAPGESAFGEYHLVGHPDRTEPFPRRAVYEFRGYDLGFQLATWETGRPGRIEPSRFEGRSVPAMGGDLERTWYHEADASTPVVVEPDVERGRLPVQVRFVAANRSRDVARCGHWNLYKLDGGEWFHVAPFYHTADCRGIYPGSGKRYVLNAYHGEALPDPEYYGPGGSVGWLGGGTYAVVAGYGPDGGHGAALVDLDGPARSVVPTDDASATRDGDVVRVSTDPPNADRESTKSVVATLERVDAAPDARRLVPEQVMRRRFRALRNALAFAAADRRVELETTDRLAERATGYDGTTTTFRFEGDAYEFGWTRDA